MKPSRMIAVVVLLWTILMSPWSPRLAQAQVAVADLTPLDSSNVSVTYSTAVTNRQTNQTTMTATVKNVSSKAVTGPVYFAIDAITPSSVTVVNAPLTSAEGIPLFVVVTGAWPAGASSAISMVFANPTRVRFDIQQRVLIKKAVTPPQVTITSPAPLSVVNLASVSVTGTVSATATSVTVNGVSATLQSQTWSATVPLQEGSNTLTAVARDAGGNTGTASLQVTRDTTPPALTATVTPQPNAAGWNNTDVTVTFAATDSLAGIATITAPVTLTAEGATQVVSGTATDRIGNSSTLDVRVSLDKTPPSINVTSPTNGITRTTSALTVTGTVSDTLSGLASVTCNSTAAVVSNATFTCNLLLAEGANTIRVQATDMAGNVGTASLAVTVDTLPPQVTITSPASLSAGHQTPIPVTGTVSADATSVTVNGIPATISNRTWTATVPLQEGNNTLTAAARDAAGNVGTTSLQVTLDTTPPTLMATLIPQPNVVGWNNTDVTVSFQATDSLSGIATVTPPVTVTADSADHVVHGTAMDRAGNSSTLDVHVHLDKTPPGVTVTSPANGTTLKTSVTTITGTISDVLSGVASVTCNGTTATVSNTTFTCNLSLAEGANTIHVQATDVAGNVGTANLAVTVDTIPPQVTITSPAPLSIGNQTPVSVTGTVSADATSVTVNGVPATITNQTWTATVALQEGNNTLTAVAHDNVGNMGTASSQMTLDTTPPTLTATATPLPNTAGWNNMDVTVTFAATDSVSGIATVTAPVTVTTESADHVVSGTATDRDGNSSTLDVHIHLDKTAPGVSFASPAHGTTLKTAVTTVTGTVSDALSGVASVTCNGTAATVSNTTFTCNVSLSEGANTIHVQATDSAGNVGSADLAVTRDTIPPHVTIETPTNNAALFDQQVRVAGTMDDQNAHVSVNGQAAPVSNGQWEVTLPLELGATTITVIATDGAGNTGQQSVQVTRRDVVLESITVMPVGSRLTAVGAQQPLTVTGWLSNGTTQNLTAGSTGTTYSSNKPFVATVSADGVVTAVGNGSTTITMQYQTFSATAEITVEAGVTLTALNLSPTRTTLRAVGASQQLKLTGSFSDGSTRDLTAATTGTTYTSSASTMATVSADGLVTAVANEETTITATNEQLHATAQITVAISSGAGFLRGEVYDDSTGLPLAQAVVTLLADGGGPVDPPITMTADDQGQFLLVGLAGEALVHIAKEGFTSVERHAVIPQDTAFTLLDARLTPRAAQGQIIPSATGGAARSQSGATRLVFPPGSVPADVHVRLTVLSNQGLQERLPLGWSPIAAVDVFPSGLVLNQSALLQVPNTMHLPPRREVLTAAYDLLGHQWIGQAPAVVTPDGQHIATEIRSTSQWVFLLPDDAPFTPPTVQTGQALQGVGPVALPTNLSASSTVVPPSAPAGDNARATGTIILETASPLPSGTRVQAHVSERFDLLDTSSVIPLPFTQDLLTYAQPRQGETASLSTQFPITPSRNFTIRELALGVVHITVTAPDADIHGTVVGTSGGTVTDAAGNTIELPANGLQANRTIDLLPRTAEQLAVAIPNGFAMLAAMQLDLVGTILAQTATLSMPRPADLPDTAQVIIAQVIGDPAGFRRLRLAALGRILGTRVVSQTQVGGLLLPGITTGGQYVFLRPPAPLGFITGVVSTPSTLSFLKLSVEISR